MDNAHPTNELDEIGKSAEDFSPAEKTRIALQNFQERLNREPDPREFQDTPDGRARTLPISYVEMTLDEMYLGLWETSQPTYQQIFNEVVGAIVLTVTHPITGAKLNRVGFASVVITQDKDATIAEFNNTKKKNALDLSFPKLKAECVKNAAQSLGKVFGRDINRKHVDAFKPPLQTLSDAGMLAAIKRLEEGRGETVALLESNFLLTETQKEILKSTSPVPKQLPE